MVMPIKSNATSLFAQEYPGAQPVYLGDVDLDCFNLDSIPDPQGAVNAGVCTDGQGRLKNVYYTRGAPDLPSWSIENLLGSAVHYLELLKEKSCPFTFHALQRCEGKAGIFSNWLRAESLYGVSFTNDMFGNLRQRDATDPITRSFDMTSLSARLDSWEIAASQKTTTETLDANTLHSYVIENCGGVCGAQAEKCETIVVGCDASGAATANVLISTDGGNTWAATAADPFAGISENITAIRMFQVGANTVRILCTRNTDAGNPGEISYSDDSGATWTEVAYGSVNGEYVVRHDGLFVLDENHLWITTDQGNVYFSSDGGLTWTIQSSAATADGAAMMYAIKFIDQNIGVATGAADAIIYTVDGGENWLAGTATGGGGELFTLHVFGRYRWIVGTDDGEIYQTWNGSTGWTEMTQFTGTGTGDITGIVFLNDLIGYATHIDSGTVGRILRTIDGGYSWIRVNDTAFASAGFNAVFACTNNHVFAVGDDDGSTAIIAEAGQ